MGIIKEPDGVTFTVENRKLTKKEEEAIEKFIAESKRKNKLKIRSKRTKVKAEA